MTDAVRQADAIGNLVFDAQIVALCREHGVTRLMTEDRDFNRSEGLATRRLAD
ncbi:MAG: PIN domain-containing protein [Alphaproteobacteria bacterium]|nr:PIN domain-containing protein [Alphaproteobacteria bacterium]